MSNPFTLSFGREPREYIKRSVEYGEIVEDFSQENPTSNIYIISGVRGSGKTVLLSSLYKYFNEDDGFVAVDLNTKGNMLEDLAASIYDNAPVKHKFLKGEFGFSFSGVTISIKGGNPVTSVSLLLEKMLLVLKKHGKKLVITVDDIDVGDEMKRFVKEFQSLFRKDLPVYLIATGLFQTIDTLESQEGLTFLQRGQKRYLSPLNMRYIALSYKSIFQIDDEKAMELAKLTKGYAFAYQTLGYLLYQKGSAEIDEKVIRDYDYYLEEYVYRRLFRDLPGKEKRILEAIAVNGFSTNKELVEAKVVSNQEISYYKDSLSKRGICDTSVRGVITISLPRFAEYIRFEVTSAL
jgi:predicted ATPase